MWLSLDTELQYRFESDISPVAFFQHLPHLLAPTGILVLGCYADTRTLQQLIRFAESVTESIDLCDHIAAYSREHPLFIYHGTFREPLYISTRIPRSDVEAFSRGIGVSFDVIDFFKTFDLVPPSRR